jgi:hypothetical protein
VGTTTTHPDDNQRVGRFAEESSICSGVCHDSWMGTSGVEDVTDVEPIASATLDDPWSRDEAADQGDRNARRSAKAFAVVIAIAVPVIFYQGRDQWFFLDDWDFLANRRATSFHDLMAPHAQHWTTLPILLYRALWWMVGIRHYWPYQLSLVLLHVAAAVLLRVIMRRASVDPWIATAAASLFLLFGAGRQDIVYSFQVTFTGALTLGLAHLVLADHDGDFDRRDLLGMGCGLLSLMCSSVGIAMVVAVGVATLLRRGWKMAAAHTVPLAAVFLAWWAAYARVAFDAPKSDLGEIVTWARGAIWNVFVQAGQVPGTGWLLALVLVGGLALRWSRLSWVDFRRFDGPTTGLAVGALCFVVTAAYGRATDSFRQGGPPTASRYVYIVAALLLPLVALAVSAFVDRWRIALPAAIAVFLVGLPGNAAALHATGAATQTLGDPDLVLTMARLPLARQVPSEVEPYAGSLAGFSIGWLLDGVASGRVPLPASSSRLTVNAAELMLSIDQTSNPPPGNCMPIESGKRVHVRPGDALVINGDLLMVTRPSQGSGPAPRRFLDASYGRTLTIVGDPLDLVVVPVPSDAGAQLCR